MLTLGAQTGSSPQAWHWRALGSRSIPAGPLGTLACHRCEPAPLRCTRRKRERVVREEGQHVSGCYACGMSIPVRMEIEGKHLVGLATYVPGKGNQKPSLLHGFSNIKGTSPNAAHGLAWLRHPASTPFGGSHTQTHLKLQGLLARLGLCHPVEHPLGRLAPAGGITHVGLHLNTFHPAGAVLFMALVRDRYGHSKFRFEDGYSGCALGDFYAKIRQGICQEVHRMKVDKEAQRGSSQQQRKQQPIPCNSA
eukprot:1160755-Pelagomonas_calceolata.AAC.2